MALEFTEENFEQMLESDKPVLVDFWAEWCGPCRLVGPIVDQIATDFEGRALVGKVNVDEQGDLSAKYGVRNIPTIICIKNGEIVDKIVGATTKDKLQEMLEKNA